MTERDGLLAQAAADQAAGRFEVALGLIERAVALAPMEGSGWATAAACLLAARDPGRALATCDEGLRRAPGHAGLLAAKGQVLQSLSRTGEAAAAFEAALAADPDRFDARFALALQALEAGGWDRAEAMAAPLAHRREGAANLAWLEARIALGRGDAATARGRLEALVGEPDLPPEPRADALLLLGEACEQLSDPAAAFAAAAQGKTIQRRLYAGVAAGREGEVAKLRRLGAWFAAADRAPWRSAPAQTPVAGAARAHVFVVGFPRSGTTLLEQALAGHPDVLALEEAPTLAEPYAALMADAGGLGRLARLPAHEAAAWRARYWATVRAEGTAPQGRVFVDKAPAGSLYLPLVAKLFPGAKVLFALRDPRDVVLSCFRQAFAMNAMTYAFTDLAQTAACYDACMAMAATYREVLPLDLCEVRHEALVADFEGELGRIFRWLGLDLTPAMLDVAATARGRPVRTPSAAQVREGINDRGVGRWRAYAKDLGPVMGVLAPWIKAFGYPAAGADG